MGERLTGREYDRAWFEQSMAVIWVTVVYTSRFLGSPYSKDTRIVHPGPNTRKE
jgi:hypothetical protein